MFFSLACIAHSDLVYQIDQTVWKGKKGRGLWNLRIDTNYRNGYDFIIQWNIRRLTARYLRGVDRKSNADAFTNMTSVDTRMTEISDVSLHMAFVLDKLSICSCSCPGGIVAETLVLSGPHGVHG